MADKPESRELTLEERQARRKEALARNRAAVEASRQTLREGAEVYQQLRITREQIENYITERQAVNEELRGLNGKRSKKSKRVRTAI